MAKLRTLLADPALAGGSTGPRADAAVFGNPEGMGNLARGLQSLGDSGQTLLAQAKQREAHLKALEDATAVNEARAYLTRTSTDFLADPTNQGKDTFHKDYEHYMLKAKSRIFEGKVSPEASRAIEASYDSLLGQGYERALSQVVALKVERASESLGDTFSSDLTAMFKGMSNFSAGTDGSLSGDLTLTDVLTQHTTAVVNTALQQTDDLFHGTLPRRAKAMKEGFVREAVMRLAEPNPEAASAVLANFSSKLDPDTQRVLGQHLDVLRKQKETELRSNMEELSKQVLTGAYNGKLMDPGDTSLSEMQFIRTYGPADGKQRYREFRDTYTAVEQARKSYDFLKGLNVSAQNETLAQFEKSQVDNPHGQRAIHLLRSLVQDNQERMEKDPTAWLTANNPAVGSAFEEYARIARDNADDPSKVAAASQKYLDRLIQYQGPPPEGADEVEAAQYLNRVRPEVMSQQLAKRRAEAFATASPDKFMQMLQELKQAFPTTEKLNLALSNMMAAPHSKGTDLSFQIFLQNMNNPALPGIIEATRKAESLKGLSEDQLADLTTEMRTRTLPKFRAMARGLGGTREDSIMAAHDVVQNYARRLMILNEGMSAGDAVEAAYAQVVDFSLYPTSVNGRDTIIPKEVGSTHFTEEQLPDMAAALQKGIDLFDSRDVDTSHFPREVSMLVDPVKREAAIRRVILEKARVSVSSDGRSMQLLVSDDTGNPYLLTDKAGRPYQVDIAEDLARSRPRLVLPPETNWDSTQVYQLRLDDPNFSWRTTDVPSTSLTYWPLLKAE